MASIRRRGPGYEVRIRRKGYPTVVKHLRTRAEAENYAQVIESEMVRAVYVDRSGAERVTLREALAAYLRKEVPKKKGHQLGYLVRSLMEESIAKLSLAQLDSTHFAAFRDEQIELYSNKTVRIKLSVFSHLYRKLINEYGFPYLVNWIKQIEKPPETDDRDRRLEPGELDRLQEACDQGGNRWIWPMILLALETAMRRGELVGMQWADIDFSRQVVLLRDVKHPKRRVSRRVPLSSKAIAILQSLPRDSESRVFPRSKDSVTQAFQRVCRRARIIDLTFHDLRHEATSRLFERGLGTMKVSVITGHETLKMLKRYTQLRPEDIARELG